MLCLKILIIDIPCYPRTPYSICELSSIPLTHTDGAGGIMQLLNTAAIEHSTIKSLPYKSRFLLCLHCTRSFLLHPFCVLFSLLENRYLLPILTATYELVCTWC